MHKKTRNFQTMENVINLLKPSKDPQLPSSYRPVLLLCHPFKLYDGLTLKRIENSVHGMRIPEQAGCKSGKSCTGQVLTLTEHIESGYENR